MVSETFEQVLSAAQADGVLDPAWKKFVNTKFFVAVVRPCDSQSKDFVLYLAGRADGAPELRMSEVRERVEAHHGTFLTSLSGAEVVRILSAEASILVALSDRAFSIANDRVAWLKKGIAASRARAAAKALEAAASAPASAAPPAAAVEAEAVEAAAPVRPRKQNGPLDVAALKPRNVSIERIGVSFLCRVNGAKSRPRPASSSAIRPAAPPWT